MGCVRGRGWPSSASRFGRFLIRVRQGAADRQGRPGRRLPGREIAVFAPLLLVVALFVTVVPTRMNRQIEIDAHNRVLGLAHLLADALTVPLEFEDTDSAARALALLASQEDAEIAVVLGTDGREFVRWQSEQGGAVVGSPPSGEPTARFGKHLVGAVPIATANGPAGRLLVSFAAAHVDAEKRANWIGAIALVLVGGGALAAMVARMLTRRRRAERALAAQEEKFSTLVEGMPDGIVIYQAGEPAYANSAARQLFGLGWGPTAPRRTMALSALEGAVESHGANSRVIEIPREEGGAMHLEVRSFALTVDGAPVTILLARDVTEEKRLRDRLALADRLASIGTLATGVAHEINNPLSYVLANLEFVELELGALSTAGAAPVAPSPETLKELAIAVRDAHGGAVRVQNIVQDMRKMARKDFGERLPVDLKKVTSQAVDVARVTAGERAQIQIDAGDVPLVMASESQLAQVIVNLVVNAAHAIPTDAPAERRKVRVSTRVTFHGSVEIAVADTGTGIPLEVRDKIFDPFFTTKPVGVGTGLGLAICHGIVRAHGGSLGFDTEVGVGTTMRVRLPASAVAATAAAPPVRAIGSSSSGRILVVDDEAPVASATARLLDRGTTEIETSARRALERLVGGERFDLVLCDVRMPDMNGPELLDALRVRAPEQARAFVFMSGALDDRAEADLGRLAVPVLEKPFDRETLRHFVSTQLERLQRSP
jgi:two-component system, cell cycle sensor histidine kinase and response regulator CckA